MGITMSAKRTITNAIAARYRAESKRGKQMMLDEFCRTTGYHRKYAIQLLGSWGTQRIHRIDGKPVAFSSVHPGSLTSVLGTGSTTNGCTMHCANSGSSLTTSVGNDWSS